MATKVLGTKLAQEDLKFLLGLAKDAKQRRIIRGLFGYQLKMIESLGLIGIDNCKQLHNTWLKWITSGCNPDDILSHNCHHGHKATLKYAQRLYTAYVQDGQETLARKWRDTVTTVLRSYQVCGPSKDDMTDMWNDSIKDNITRPLDSNSEKAIIRGCAGIPFRFNEPSNATYIYECCSSIKSYFDMIERHPDWQEHGFYKALCHFVPNLSPDEYSLLIKKGPHTRGQKSFSSIFGEALDMHALSNAYPGDATVSYEDTIGEFIPSFECERVLDIYKTHSDKSLLEIVNDLSETLLDTYKHSERCRKNRLMSLEYFPQIPCGTVPTDISVAAGRTVLLRDKAGKTRPISIATYTMNNALAPLHRELFCLLARIRQDSTDQNKGIIHITQMTSKPDKYICSADLSSATDRLPVALQAYILYRILKLSKQLNASKLASCWYTLMSQTPFVDPVDNNLVFRYGTGQPMGVYTSWPMLALTNHIMIRTAYWISKDKSLDYLVCGDDTVIGSKEPFKLYERWMNSLGVTINRSKSHITESNDPIKVAEFCKRLAVNGEIVSSESPKILIRPSRPNGAVYQSAAIECIHSMLGPLSRKRLASLIGHRVDERKLALPYRYGGFGSVDNRPFHMVLLEDNFIFLYIYKKMRSYCSALETQLNTASLEDQLSIDKLSMYADSNPFRKRDKDWRLMGAKYITPINQCRQVLELYERFLVNALPEPLTEDQLLQLVSETFSKLKDISIPIRLSSKDVSKDDKTVKSREAITYQRLYTRACKNLKSGRIHVFYDQAIHDIDVNIIDYEGNPVDLTNSKDFVLSLDQILFTE